MELRHLRYFVMVAEHQNVRAASERLYVTQPAVSRQIHDLEAELGVSLFDRTSRGLRLTDAGHVFRQDALRILAAVDSAKQSARLRAAGLEGNLRIGLTESAGWDGLVPDAIGQLQRTAPGIRIQLFPMATPRQLAALQDESLDGGFVYVFDAPPADLVLVPLARHDIILAVPETSALAGQRLARAADLGTDPFVVFEREVYPAYHDRLMAACQQAGLTPRIVQQVESESAVLSLVSAGIGVALVNGANQGRPPARVRFVPLADLSVPLSLSFAYLATNRNPTVPRFVAALANTGQARPTA